VSREIAIMLLLHIDNRAETNLEQVWKYGKKESGTFYRVTCRLRGLAIETVEEIIEIAKYYEATICFGHHSPAEPQLELT
jgi:hypothetical protein